MPDETPEPKSNIDLSDLRLMPKWVADFGKTQHAFTADEPETQDRPRGPRPPRGRDDRGSGRGGERRFPPRGDRPPPRGDRPQQGDRERRHDRGPRDDRRGGRDRFDRNREHDRGPRHDGPPPVPGLVATVEPDPRAVEAMAQMIRAAGKAYSVFEAAKLVLASGERFRVAFSRENPGAPKFVVVTADQSVWLTRDEALAHLVSCEEVLGQFYRAEQIELEEPKGNFTNIAICGFSGQMLGPPSHHSYQTNLHKLHRERFSNMPFEDYKRRVRTEATPEAVEKWKESQKHGVQWIDLKAEVPEGGEAPRFKTRSEMETHFRTHHVESLLGESERPSVAGDVSRGNLSPQLFNAMRRSVDEARKHLLVTAQLLCAAFEKHGLKLFKRRGGKLWVSRARPRLLDHSVVLSDRIAKLVELIKSHNGIAVKDLLEIVAPAHAATETPAPVASTPETPAAESAEPTSAPQTETAVPQENAPQVEASPERLQALKDLHWLNSEGYIVEYADGVVCIGVIEPPPAKPKATKEKTPAAVTAEAVPAAAEPAPTEAASAELTSEDIPVATSEEAPAPPTVAEAEEKAPPVE